MNNSEKAAKPRVKLCKKSQFGCYYEPGLLLIRFWRWAVRLERTKETK